MKKYNKIWKYILMGFGLYCLVAIALIGFNYLKEKEEILLDGEEKITVSLNNDYTEPGYKVVSNRKNKKYVVSINGFVDTTKVGTYKVEYTMGDKTVIRTITVIDDIKPVITIKGEIITYICPNTKYKEEGYTAIDNVDKDITDKVKVTTTDYNIKYSVSDSSGNKEEIIRTIVYKDVEKPKIIFNTSSTIYKGKKFNNSYKVTDNCDGNITSKTSVTGSVDTSKIGTYTLNYSITDKAGNKNEITRKISVIEKPSYTGSTIYLTFDDGPSTDVTPKVLDVLKKYNIKATFFVINHSSATDYLIKRAYNEGHTIGLHSASHNYKKIYTSEEAFFNDLNKIENKVINLTGTSSKIIRFPGGSSNTVSKSYKKGIMSNLTNEVKERGYIYQDWNVGSSDTSTQNSTKICNNVKKRLGTGTNIVLLHDYSGHSGTLNALPCIIEYGLNAGYTFSNITTTTKQIHHKVAN